MLLFGGLLVLAIVVFGSRWFSDANPKSILKIGKGFGVGLLLGLALLLLVTGKFPLALAALAGAATWGLRLMSLHNFYRSARQYFGGTRTAGGAGADTKARPGTMTREEALAVLGLDEGADADAVKAAYRRLMTGLHPDHGGSDFLAAQINRARDTLLGK